MQIIVSDCMYNPKLFDILLQTLGDLAGAESTIVIGYRTRGDTFAPRCVNLARSGVDENHDAFFSSLKKAGFAYDRAPNTSTGYGRTNIFLASRAAKSDA